MRARAPSKVRLTNDPTTSNRPRFAWPVLLVTLFAAVAMLMAATGMPAAHASGIAVQSQQAQSSFPNGIVFKASVSSEARISQARLRFQILPSGPVTLLNVDCGGDTLANCSKTVGGANGIYIVPFTQVRYSWEFKDDTGATTSTAEATITYEDTRFDWKSLSDGNLTVYYYSGDVDTMREILRVGRETIERISRLHGTRLDFPVKVLDYASARDLQPAVASSRFGGSGITLGEVSSADTAIETRQTFGSNGDPLDTVRHELAHVVTDYATRGNPNLDIWINEGISVSAQSKLDSGYKTSLERMVRNNSALTIASLNSVQLRSNNPNMFYSQSYSLVNFLIETYGETKFQSFSRALNTGLTNDALTKVYGFDVEGLDAEWRKSIGLPERPPITDANTGILGVLPTIVPFGATTSGSQDASTPQQATPANEGSAVTQPGAGDSGRALILVGGLGTLVGVSLLLYVLRRSKAAAT